MTMILIFFSFKIIGIDYSFIILFKLKNYDFKLKIKTVIINS